MSERVYRESLGIATGDIVTTSYRTGPYEVWSISGPRYTSRFAGVLVVRTWPVISMTVIEPDKPGLGRVRSVSRPQYFYINDVRQEADGRWFTDQINEVYVEKPAARPAIQTDIFRSQPSPEEPYDFQDGVDYRWCPTYAGRRRVWHCDRCGLDFNKEPISKYGRVPCVNCESDFDTIEIILMLPRKRGTAQASECQLYLGYTDDDMHQGGSKPT